MKTGNEHEITNEYWDSSLSSIDVSFVNNVVQILQNQT